MADLITVVRNRFTSDETFGEAHIKGKFECFTLEDEIRAVKKHGETAIWYGRYPLGLHDSPKFSNKFYYSEATNTLITTESYLKMAKKGDFKAHKMIHIQEVPQFEFILIHPLNTENQTEGCLGVGRKIGKLNSKPAILESVAAYLAFYPKVYPAIKKALLEGRKEYILYTK